MSIKNQPKYFIIFFLLAFLDQFCTSPENKEALDKMKWMEGRWENEKDGLKTIEVWQRNSGNTYTVNGWMLEGSDTIFTENITVKPGSGGIKYTVTIANQNNGKPVVFSLAENTGNKLEFKNPEHDFPQLIAYTRIDENSVLVQLKGMLKGKPVEEEYTLNKR